MQVAVTATAPADWDAYISQHPSGTAYHRAAAVNIGVDACGLKASFLTARNGEQIVGALPLLEQSSLLFGRYLVSVPYLTYGGILASHADAVRALADAAGELARARRADHVELRHMEPMPELRFQERLDRVSMMLSLPQSEAELSKRLGAKLRSQIRRAERESPEVVFGGAELIPEFYAVFAQSMHSLGTPVYSRRFFEITERALAGLITFVVVRVRGSAEAAGVLVRHGNRIEVPWAACTETGKRGAINMRLYWEMLQYGVRERAEKFDFGRSAPDSGTYKFKAQWGAQPVQLHWHYWLPNGAQLPRLNHSNPKYALAASMWRKMPLWCANLIGPHIVRNLP